MALKEVLLTFCMGIITIYGQDSPFECPLLETTHENTQCLCYKRSQILKCFDKYDFIATSNQLFKTINIQGLTNANTIALNISVTSSNLYIENNKYITTIEIVKEMVENLVIRDNPQLTQTSIDQIVNYLPIARQLIIEGNEKFSKILPKYFVGSTKLTKIYLRNNKIESIAFDAFTGLIALKELKLDHNALVTPIILNQPILIVSPFIDISLSENNIDLPNGLIANSSENSIVNLYLDYMNLKTLDELIFEPFLKKNVNNKVFLRGNPFTCTCDENWVFKKHVYKTQIYNMNCKLGENIVKEIFRLGPNNDCSSTEPPVPSKQTDRVSSSTTEPTVPIKQPDRIEPTTTIIPEPVVPTKQTDRKEPTTTIIPEPVAPTKQTDRKEPTTTIILEPVVPTKQTDRKEPTTIILEPIFPTKQTDRKEPTTIILEPIVPTKQTDRKEPTTIILEPVVPAKQTDRKEPTTTTQEPLLPTKQAERNEPEPGLPIKQPERIEPEPKSPVIQAVRNEPNTVKPI